MLCISLRHTLESELYLVHYNFSVADFMDSFNFGSLHALVQFWLRPNGRKSEVELKSPLSIEACYQTNG